MRSWVWNRWALKAWALAEGAGGTLGLAHCLDVERNGRVGGCLIWGLGCSRRREIVPSNGGVGM